MPTDTVPTHDCVIDETQVLRTTDGEFGTTTVYRCTDCDRTIEVHKWSFPEPV